MLVGCRLVAVVLLLCLELCRKSLHAAPHRVCGSSAVQRNTNPAQKLLAEDCLGRGGGGFVLFVGSVCWFKAVMLRGLLIGKAGVLLMIAVFGK